MTKLWRLFLLSLFLLTSSGCEQLKTWIATEFMQGQISDGVARLSAQHLSIITSEINKKFDSVSAVITKAEHEDNPELFGTGQASFTLNDIEINYPAETTVYKDCLGAEA